jgi:hypothetical protein
MGLFLFRFWVALVPMAIYVVWFLLVRHRAIKNNQPLPQFRDTPLYWAILASLLVAGICFVVLGMSQKRNATDYTPPARISPQLEKPSVPQDGNKQLKQKKEPVSPIDDVEIPETIDPETDEWGGRGSSRYVPTRYDENGNMIPAHVREDP